VSRIRNSTLYIATPTLQAVRV